MAKTIVADIPSDMLSLTAEGSDRFVYSNYFVPVLLTFADDTTPILPFYKKQTILEVAGFGPVDEEDILGIFQQLGVFDTWKKNGLDDLSSRIWGSLPKQSSSTGGSGGLLQRRRSSSTSPPSAASERAALNQLRTGTQLIAVRDPNSNPESRPTVLDNQTTEFIAGLLQSDVGLAFLDRTRITPIGFALGEHVFALGLAPGEEVVLEQKTFSKRQLTFEEQNEQEQQFDIELSSTLSTAVEEGFQKQRNLSDSWGLNLSHTGNYTSPTGTWGTFNASHTIGYTKNVTDGHQESASRSVKDNQTASSKVAAKYRTQHKTDFKLSTEQGMESTSKRTVRNPNRTSPITLNYFKVLQRLQMRQERYGVRLCWAPCVKDPALTFFEKIRKGRQSILDTAQSKIPLPPQEPKPSSDGGGQTTTTVETKWVESPLITADRWGLTGDMRADYQVDIPQPDDFEWDGQTADIEASLNLVTRRPLETIGRYLVGSPYAVDDAGGRKLRTTVHIGAPSWVGGPGIQFQLGARFKKDITVTPQVNQDTKYNDDLAAYRTALKDWTDARDVATADAEKAADSFEQRIMQGLSPVNEMVSQIIELYFPANVRDECWEIDYWQRIFDWERASFVAYPSWWSRSDARDSLLDPSDFLNASWAKLYLPVRPGMELGALRWIYGKAVATSLPQEVEDRFNVLIDDLENVRYNILGTDDEGVDLTQECQDTQEKAYCLARWSEVMPTDGTHIEVVQGATTAADAITATEIEDASILRGALIDNEQRSGKLKDKALDQMTEAATIKVKVGDGGSPSAG